MLDGVGRVVSVNVGRPRPVTFEGREVLTSIWKDPVEGPVAARGTNLDGDEQSDLENHGGTDKAVYAYAAEDQQWWSAELHREFGPASMGENLTISGVDVATVLIGERWRVGTVEFEVSQPRVPCYKLGLRHGLPELPRLFAAAGRPGVYLRITTEGVLVAGDAITVVHRPAHGVTIGLAARAYHQDRSLAARLLDAPELTPSWHDWARRRVG
jgi:MOSC domain-containing protein YiiM